MTGDQAEMAVLDSQTHDERNNEPAIIEVGGINDLVLVVKGEIVETNFQEVAKQIKSQVALINEDLKTDADFENAKTIANNLRAATKKMAEVKANALAEAEELYATFSAIDDVSATCTDKAKALEKTIAKRKEKLKTEIVEAADLEIYQYMNAQSDDFKDQRYGDEIYNKAGLDACIYRKSSFDKMNESLDAYVAEAKKRVDERVALIDANAAKLDAVDAEYKTLFQNRVQLLGMDTELLVSTISQYIANHKAEQLQRELDEKAERDAAEAQRVADEQAAEEKRLADIAAAAELAESELETMVDEVQESLNETTVVDDDLGALDNPQTEIPPTPKKIDNRPPSGFGRGSSVPKVEPMGSPVPVVKSEPEAETVAAPAEQPNPDAVGVYEMTIRITGKLERAQQIAKIAHGRLKNMPEVSHVGLRDTAKPTKQLKAIIEMLRESNEHRAANQITRFLERK